MAIRERTYSWKDPLQTAAQALQMPGIDFLQAIIDGNIPPPPVMHTLDIKLGTLQQGVVTFSFTPQEFHYNPIGMVHGGVITTILDSAMGCALHSTLPQGVAYTTLELKVNFLKAVSTKTGLLTATGRLIQSGNRVALTEAQLTDASGNIYAHATSTCMLLKKEG